MIQCFGRSLHTLKMPKKPIKQGYRVFTLAEHDYIQTFSWSSRKQDIMEMFIPTIIPAAIPSAIPSAIPEATPAVISTAKYS